MDKTRFGPRSGADTEARVLKYFKLNPSKSDKIAGMALGISASTVQLARTKLIKEEKLPARPVLTPKKKP